MGDRVPVTITVPIEHKEKVIQLLEEELGQPGDYWGNIFSIYVLLQYDEVNYAQIKSLHQLTKAGIAYDYAWEEGGGFNAGEEHTRFNKEGELVITADCPTKQSGTLEACFHLVNASANLKEALQKITEAMGTVIPMGWENQVAYGQLYCAKQLINPTKE